MTLPAVLRLRINCQSHGGCGENGRTAVTGEGTIVSLSGARGAVVTHQSLLVHCVILFL